MRILKFDVEARNYRHPVLLAVDDFHALYSQTMYRDPHFQPIKSYHLSMPRLLLDYASGRKTFVSCLPICLEVVAD